MNKTIIKFMGCVIESGNDVYKTMMKARKLSEGHTSPVIVETENKEVLFINGIPEGLGNENCSYS